MEEMRTTTMLYGEPRDVANELCACNDPEGVLHVDLIAALGNALTRIANLEDRLSKVEQAATKAANDASCLANGIIPD
jgi:hypothetical protein